MPAPPHPNCASSVSHHGVHPGLGSPAPSTMHTSIPFPPGPSAPQTPLYHQHGRMRSAPTSPSRTEVTQQHRGGFPTPVSARNVLEMRCDCQDMKPTLHVHDPAASSMLRHLPFHRPQGDTVPTGVTPLVPRPPHPPSAPPPPGCMVCWFWTFRAHEIKHMAPLTPTLLGTSVSWLSALLCG